MTSGELACDLVHEPSPASLADLPARPEVRGEALLEALQRSLPRDRQRGHTCVGPHLEDMRLDVDGRPARTHASQGQCRSLVLALKMAEFRSLERATSEPPVLLLDDVSSELDATRNALLMRFLDAAGGQVFLSTTDVQHIHLEGLRTCWHVEGGRIREVP
jgi:DNA replication and repair protein RecF